MDTVKAALDYLNGNGTSTPFFVAFDASADLSLLVSSLSSCDTIRMSEFCHAPDALPDLDSLCDRLTHASGKAILLGVGEYAALSGDREVKRWLFGLTLHNFRLVVPVWNGHIFLDDESRNDPRVQGRRGVAFAKTDNHWSIRIFKEGLVKNPDATGFRALMRILEDGCNNALTAVTTVVPLNNIWCRRIDSAYEVFKERYPKSNVREEMFSEKQWSAFLNEDRIRDDSLPSADSLLRLLEDGTGDDQYLSFVISKTRQYSEWRSNLLCAILEISPDDELFPILYGARKKIISHFDNADMTDFIRESYRISDPSVRVCYMTDTTALEREEIMRIVVATEDVPDAVEMVYPLLWDYWRKFMLCGDAFSKDLTQYFQDYKRQKLLGRIEPSFMEIVRDLAEDRPQFALPTRESVLESIGTDNVALCWVDALGCEFLGFIQAVAERRGLKLKVTPARAKLPSITSVNRQFYDEWTGEKMPPFSRLDKIKHGDFVKFDDTDSNVATELPHELQVVEEAINAISARLRKKPGSKVVLASDHGATRLAVISHNETVWELPEKGKHSGRCCRKSEFDGILPPCSTDSEDEKWHILAGYDRFRGGRQGDVEVHGGATLEEMVVPVIEFELLGRNIHVKLAEEKFKVTFRDTEITLQFFCSATLTAPSVAIGESRYKATANDSEIGWYDARIPKPVAGDHVAIVYDGDTKIDEVRFSVISGGAQIKNDDFF